jgi:hypothetical protein
MSLINPYDQFTGTAKIDKIFNHGILTLGTSVVHSDYEIQGSEDYTAKTFRENGAFWLGPVFYAYSDGSFTMRSNTSPNVDSTAYRVVGGIGTRQFGLFRASFYFGPRDRSSLGRPGVTSMEEKLPIILHLIGRSAPLSTKQSISLRKHRHRRKLLPFRPILRSRFR